MFSKEEFDEKRGQFTITDN